MKLLVIFSIYLTVLGARLSKCLPQSQPDSQGVDICKAGFSAQNVGYQTKDLWGIKARNAKRRNETTILEASQYTAIGGIQACANIDIIKDDARKAWDQLRQSCRKIQDGIMVPKKTKLYNRKHWRKSREHGELIVEVYGNAVAYLCNTGSYPMNSCEYGELDRAEKMMACPGSPRLFERYEAPEPRLLSNPDQAKNHTVGTILIPDGETSVNPNDWKFVKEGKLSIHLI